MLLKAALLDKKRAKMDDNCNEMGPSRQESLPSEGAYTKVMNGIRSFNLHYFLKEEPQEEPQEELGTCGLPAAPIHNLEDNFLCNDPYSGENLQRKSEVVPNPDSTQTQNVAPAVPSATCKLPCLEEYPGPYNFELEFKSESSEKNKWLLSQPLKKLFVNMQSKIPIQFKWTQKEMGLRVRALPVFFAQESFEFPVVRCPIHSSPDEASNEGFEHVNHVIRCDHKKVEYHTDSESQRLSVVVPMDMPQPGTDWVTVVYTFMCKNSCSGGMNRRATAVIFTLERLNGEVLGRRTMKVRICSCPRRDREKEEKDAMNTSLGKQLLNDKPHHPHEPKRLKVDNRDDVVKIWVMRKHAKLVAQYAYSLVAGQAFLEDRELTAQEMTAMEGYREIM